MDGYKRKKEVKLNGVHFDTEDKVTVMKKDSVDKKEVKQASEDKNKVMN